MSERKRLTRHDVALRYRCSESTVDRKWRRGELPAPEKLGAGKSRVRWIEPVLDQFDLWVDRGLTGSAAVKKVQPYNRYSQDEDDENGDRQDNDDDNPDDDNPDDDNPDEDSPDDDNLDEDT